MSAYPAAGDYYKAVQFPARAFTVPRLQAAEFVWDSLGPTLARGSSAVVFEAAVEGRPQALRCYVRNDASSRDRYSALNSYLASHDLRPYVSGAIWLDDAIRVNQATWPVLTMEWVDGRTLNEYVDFLVAASNGAALSTLAVEWRELIALLQSSEFAHGDLQHGNIMVDQEGRLRLVDFDGVWIPQLAGQAPPTEFGHSNYQHPGPSPRVWDRWVDTFSALVIYLSLVALGKDPALWLALNNSKNLLLAKSDFLPPFQTEAWTQLAALGDPEVDDLIRRLQRCCSFDWVSSQSLEATLGASATPPPAAGQRWWQTSPAHAGSAAGAPPAGPALAATVIAQAAKSLPAPPPLSAPLSTAGTGPITELRRTMAPPGETWWTGPVSPPRVAYPQRPAPRAPAQPPRAAGGRSHAGNALLQNPIMGGIVLGAGAVLLIAGASDNAVVLVIIGLVAVACGIWWLVSSFGGGARPPGQS
jgi:eukaryotic-like serine/threonine-protein kinase